MSDWKIEVSQERETLVTCPACKGSGNKITEFPDGRYAMRPCRWCEGVTGVTKDIHRKFKRWERIASFSRGRCKL